ncbi:hypothetical protein PROFUN_07183 [Planoprotostelium fungivorum]|uniref:START domain-containing protein n=1 Tax=Planoprotostelium fungivorum TaxID=1890364 RepID=A0A2P6NMG2_9EUKA|nr:hypothetical protein PROFUN_07183 [Planoprotostelium fungivorum]
MMGVVANHRDSFILTLRCPALVRAAVQDSEFHEHLFVSEPYGWHISSAKEPFASQGQRKTCTFDSVRHRAMGVFGRSHSGTGGSIMQRPPSLLSRSPLSRSASGTPTRSPSASTSYSQTPSHIIASIKALNFIPVEEYLMNVGTVHWALFADHLFSYCDEIDVWPLLSWVSDISNGRHTMRGLNLDSNFTDMIINRFSYSDTVVSFQKRYLAPFHQNVKRAADEHGVRRKNSDESNDLSSQALMRSDGHLTLEVVSGLMNDFLPDFIASFEFSPLPLRRVMAKWRGKMGSGTEIINSQMIRLLQWFILPVILNPSSIDLGESEEERTIEHKNLLIECGECITALCQQKALPPTEPYASLFARHNAKMNAVAQQIMDLQSIELSVKILAAQCKPDEKRIQREEEKFRRYLESFDDSSRTVSPNASVSSMSSIISNTEKKDILMEKLREHRWKLMKNTEGVSLYTSINFQGVSARVELVVQSTMEKVLKDLMSALFTKYSDATVETLPNSHKHTIYKKDFPFPFSPRFYAVHTYTEVIDDEGFLYIEDDDPIAAPPSFQRTIMHLGGAHLTRIREKGMIHIEMMVHIDLCGSIPKWVNQMQNKKVAHNLLWTAKQIRFDC